MKNVIPDNNNAPVVNKCSKLNFISFFLFLFLWIFFLPILLLVDSLIIVGIPLFSEASGTSTVVDIELTFGLLGRVLFTHEYFLDLNEADSSEDICSTKSSIFANKNKIGSNKEIKTAVS